MEKIILNGNNLTIEQLCLIGKNKAKVELSDNAKLNIKKCRQFVEDKINSGETIYGLNTGIGEFSEVRLNDNELEDFQKYLIYNHSAGIGEPAPLKFVRVAIASRINVHAKGHSGCRIIITETLIELLNKDVIPFVCQKGSVGASGDLAPMAQIALVLMGEGKAYFKGTLYDAKKALSLAGISPPGLKARDGLAVINGSNFLTSMSALFLQDTENWLKQSEIAAAMCLDALKANLSPIDMRIHKLRGFSGSVKCAKNLNLLLKGGDNLKGKLKAKIQDAYSLRSTPQVVGSVKDYISYCRKQIEIELNGVGDNPIFIPSDKVQVSGANFQGTPVSFPLDLLGVGITMVSVLSERRLNRLNNPALSQGLPPFLVKNAGMFSGLMLSQYTADTQIVEQKILSTPASIQSIPAAADQEDFVSMGMNTAIKNFQILDNAYGILGIEFMAASQALDLRNYKFGLGVDLARKVVREKVDFLDIDRPLYEDHTNMKELVKSNHILKMIEKKIGEIE